VRGDIDLDGDVDATDKSTIQTSMQGLTLGRAVISAVGNVRAFEAGIAGSESGSTIHFRSRDIDVGLGRWSRRDPNSYIDGANLYEALHSSPLINVDYYGGSVVSMSSGVDLGWYFRKKLRSAAISVGVTVGVSVGTASHAYLECKKAAEASQDEGEKIGEKLEDEAESLGLPPQASNGPINAFQHCFTSCKICQAPECGAIESLITGTGKEIFDPYADSLKDLYNNVQGLRCCKLGDCYKCCMKLNKLELLDTRTFPDTMGWTSMFEKVGGGSGRPSTLFR
jgi:hypothetical protein